MSSFANPGQLFALAAYVSWPLAAGLAVVLWSKARAARQRRQAAVLDGQLQGLFRTLEARPVPARLELVVDALAEHEELARAVREAAPAAPRSIVGTPG